MAVRFKDAKTFKDLLEIFMSDRAAGSKQYHEEMTELGRDPVRVLAEATAAAQQLTNAVVHQMLVLIIEKEDK